MVTVEFVDEVVGFLGSVEGITRSVGLVCCVPEKKGFGFFDAVDLFGDRGSVFV